MTQWLLPENSEDFISGQAKKIESWRRDLLDLYTENGYQYVMPSMLEYVDSLNAYGKDLDLDTFKVVDQATGKMMGISSDLTTQVSRIDSQMNQNEVNKFCYAGSILRTRPLIQHSRELYQIGTEYFGEESIKADVEVQSLLIKSLKLLNIKNIIIDLNHLDIYKSLIDQLNLSINDCSTIAEAAMLKDNDAIKESLSSHDNREVCNKILSLLEIYGDKSVLTDVVKLFPGDDKIKIIVEKLKIVCSELEKLSVKVSFDFSDIRGYQYHTGLIFSAYSKGFPSLISQGGRYDNINKAFGSIRPATGFSLDLRFIVNNINNIKK